MALSSSTQESSNPDPSVGKGLCDTAYSPSQTDGGQSLRTLNVIKPGFVISDRPKLQCPGAPSQISHLPRDTLVSLLISLNRHLWNAYPIPGMVLSKGYVTGGIRHGYCPFISLKWDFPAGPVVVSRPANVGDTGSRNQDPTCCRVTKLLCHNY